MASREKRLINSLKPRAEIKAPVATDMFLPNSSKVMGADSKIKIKGLQDGSVLFAKNNKIDEDNANLFWDDTNKRLGINTTADPNVDLDVGGDLLAFQIGVGLITIPLTRDLTVGGEASVGTLRIAGQANNLSLNSKKIIDVLDPTANQDAATKKYVDDEIAGVPAGFGAMYNDNTDTTVTIGTAGVAVIIPSGMTAGQLNGVTFANARELTVTEPGKYKIDWSISFRMAAGSNHEIEGSIGIGGARNAQGSAHRFIGTNTDTGNMAGTAILDLADNAVVSLMMQNDSNTEDIVVNHASLTLVQVGGT